MTPGAAVAGAAQAHGVGTRADLPLPLLYVAIGGALALVVSFAALGVLWRQPRLAGERVGRPLPGPIQAVSRANWVPGAARGLALAALLLVLAVAFAGPVETPANLAPWALYVTFWVGLVPVSLLLGPVWAAVNPLRTLHAGLARFTGKPRAEHLLPQLGYWPAAASLLAFAWFELAAPDRAAPARVGVFVAAYCGAHLAAAAVFGERWFAQGEGFEVYARLLGRLSPLAQRTDGVVIWRSPLAGAAGQPSMPGLAAVMVVLVGSTAFDGLTRTIAWQDGPGASGDSPGVNTVGLLGCVAAVAALFAAATAACGRIGRYSGAIGQYAHTLVPIAAGYAIAHYFSLLLFDGQTTFILASDPFGTGANLFGTAGMGVDYSVVGDRTISLVQTAAIVAGHVVAVTLAHDRALVLARAGGGHPVLGQIPMLIVMVAFTLGALFLLLGA
jgi:hypothetical protein